MTARSDSGFSLLEVVVALAVFSLGALATLNVLGESGRSATIDEERMVAGVVAENRIAELMAQTQPPGPGTHRGVERAMGRDWEWEQVIGASPDPRILRIDVKVREPGETQVVSQISSFRAAAR